MNLDKDCGKAPSSLLLGSLDAYAAEIRKEWNMKQGDRRADGHYARQGEEWLLRVLGIVIWDARWLYCRRCWCKQRNWDEQRAEKASLIDARRLKVGKDAHNCWAADRFRERQFASWLHQFYIFVGGSKSEKREQNSSYPTVNCKSGAKNRGTDSTIKCMMPIWTTMTTLSTMPCRGMSPHIG